VATLTLDPSVRAKPTQADRLARQHRKANLAALSQTQPQLASSVGALPDDVTWVFGRDGCLTAFELDERWITGCSVPLLTAQAVLKTLDAGTGTACFLSPSHAAQLRVTLERLSLNQALICIVPDPISLNRMLHCDDFSSDLARGRLWFASGEKWPDKLTQILEAVPGLATPSRFIRLPHADASVVEALIVDAQRVFAEQNTRRSNAIAEMRAAWRPRNEKRYSRLCVIARSTFRLWDDAGHVLNNALSESNSCAIECSRFDPDEPSGNSPFALAVAISEADAIISADVSRAEAPKLASDEQPWLTWITAGRIPPFTSAGPNDRLLLTDADWKQSAIVAGWPEQRLTVAGWPSPAVTASIPAIDRSLTLIADTVSLEMPESLSEFSSHCLLWDKVRDLVLADPFSIKGSTESWLHDQARADGIAPETLNISLFISHLIIPAYQQALAELLIKAGLPVRLYGAGWSDLPNFKTYASGPVTSREHLSDIARDAAALVSGVPSHAAHEIDAMNRPVISPCDTREQFIREAKSSVSTAYVACSAKMKMQPLSSATISSLLNPSA
jgi:hypothetical protein